MKVQFKFLNQGDCVHIEISGQVTKEKLIQAQQLFVNAEWYHPGLDEICEFTNCSFEKIDPLDILELISLQQSTREIDRQAKIAFVSDQPTVFQLVSEYILMGRELSGEIKQFSNFLDAKTWIDKPRIKMVNNAYPNCRRRKSTS